MQKLKLIVDFNGIAIFDPKLLQRFYGEIGIGENLYERFIRTDDGDKIVAQGIVVPILSINDSTYKIFLRNENEPSSLDPEIIVTSNEVFPLKISHHAVITDMASLLEWDPDEDWQTLDTPPGAYSVRINGFRLIENNLVTDFGFEIVLTESETLPAFTGSLSKNMQVLELPG